MKKLIIISDFIRDPLYRQEFQTAVNGYTIKSQRPYLHYVPVYSSDIQAGFMLHQILITEERFGVPNETVIYVSTDPFNKMEKGLILQHPSGLQIIGPNIGMQFSFIKDQILKAYTYDPLNKEAIFWSRNNYPRVIAHLMEYEIDDLELEQVPLSEIHEIRETYVCHRDSFGSLKTNITLDTLKNHVVEGQSVQILLNSTKYTVRFSRIPIAEDCIYIGSSGEPNNPYMEIKIQNVGKEVIGMRVEFI